MDEHQKPSSPFLASRIIRGGALTFVAVWLFYILYVDPTRATIDLDVSRIYLSVGGLCILLAFAFNAVASSVKILEERLKRLEQNVSHSQNQGNAG
jgi:hypothetical protein